MPNAPVSSPVRILTCGSVQNGKSTFVRRLLYDSDFVGDEQLRALERDGRKCGTIGENVDRILLADGLKAESENGMDIAHRNFSSAHRNFIIADTPGDEQYTGNMVTAALTAEIMVLLVDARNGLLPQTRRDSVISNLMGIRYVILAVNKMDLINFSREVFEQISAAYSEFAARLNFTSIVPIPISARFGDNVVKRSERTSWYLGPTVLDCLDALDVQAEQKQAPFRMPVQSVNRSNDDFGEVCGTISSGSLRIGEEIIVANSGRKMQIGRIFVGGRDNDVAEAGQVVTLVSSNKVEVTCGDLLSSTDNRPEVATQFAAHLVWIGERPLFPSRSYIIRMGNRFADASVTELKHRFDISTLDALASKTLQQNETGEVNIKANLALAFDRYKENRETGSFILIDRETNQTVGAGVVLHGLRRAQNVHQQHFSIEKISRARIKSQKACIVWFTGLPASGKSTIADLVERELFRRGYHTMLLDGDNFRHGLNRDLGFTPEDRVENIRRAGEVARLMVDAGLIVLCAFISPFKMERQLVRRLVGEDEFMEVFIDTPLNECIKRDPKGLYKKALAGEIPNFTGITAPYELPDAPQAVLQTSRAGPQVLADDLIKLLETRGIIQPRQSE